MTNIIKLTEANPLRPEEFNHLIISNFKHFYSDYNYNTPYYLSPFKLLYNLEKKILLENVPDETILIPFKHGRYIYFRRLKIGYNISGVRCVVYKYMGEGCR